MPGKIFAPIPEGGACLLEHIYQRMLMVHGVDHVVVLSPHGDEQLMQFCRQRQIEFYSGPAEDVRERYRMAARYYDTDYIIRATGDNPCVDPDVATLTLRELIHRECDLFSYANLPLGIAVEAFTRSALESEAIPAAAEHKEHVSLHIKHNPSYFHVIHEEHPVASGREALPRLTVDTPEDLEVVRGIYNRLGERFSVSDILSLFDSYPSLFHGNSHVRQIVFPMKDVKKR